MSKLPGPPGRLLAKWSVSPSGEMDGGGPGSRSRRPVVGDEGQIEPRSRVALAVEAGPVREARRVVGHLHPRPTTRWSGRGQVLAGPITSRELQQRLGLSQSTVSRLLRRAGPEVVRLGRGPTTRYARAVAVFGTDLSVPLFAVNETGLVEQIGNSDLHLYNISLAPRQDRFALLPVYDMLPMAYAPVRGEIRNTALRPPVRTITDEALWRSAGAAAIDYWSTLAGDDQLSSGFCALSREQARRGREVLGA